MAAFSITSVQDAIYANQLRIATDGATRAAPGVGTGDSAVSNATTNWETLLGENSARRQVQIQNQSAGVPVFIRFWLDENNTGAPYRIDPGVTYSFPPGVTYRGKIQFRADNEAAVAVIAFNEPEETEDN